MESIQNSSGEKAESSIRVPQDCISLWWSGKNCYSLVEEFWFICHIHQTMELQISIYFGLHKILLMEKNLIPWKTIKGTWKNSLLKKIKNFWEKKVWGRWNYEIAWKMAEDSRTKWWVYCSIKFLGKDSLHPAFCDFFSVTWMKKEGVERNDMCVRAKLLQVSESLQPYGP